MNKRKDNRYFEDWTFILNDDKAKQVFIFNIRVSKNENESKGILQIVQCMDHERRVLCSTTQNVNSKKDRIKLGENSLGVDDINIDLEETGCLVKAAIEISHKLELEHSFFKPGVMGIYKRIPFLEFYHEIFVLKSTVVGEVIVNHERYCFDGGSCYIQKQWGKNFPNIWMWAQCSLFEEKHDLVVAVGVARLKIGFNYYTAFAIPIHYNGKIEIFSNYNGGHIAKLYRYKGYVHLIVIQKNKVLDIKIYGRDNALCLANKETHGVRDIYECEEVKMEVKLTEGGQMIFEDVGLHCSIQMGGNTSRLK